MILHNIKVALRNLMKYKLQTAISVLSIAIGIVTLAFAHAALSGATIPSICSQPYYDRTYVVSLEPAGNGGTQMDSTGMERSSLGFTLEIMRALKRDGGPQCVEQMAMPNGDLLGDVMEFGLCDSMARKAEWLYTPIDPAYFPLIGLRSAITGQPLKRMKRGEAVISRRMATAVFGDVNPVGAVCSQTHTLRPWPLTIVDVYEDLSTYEPPLSAYEPYVSNRTLFFSLGEMEDEGIETNIHTTSGTSLCMFHAEWIDVVLKEDHTEQQLQEELDARLQPFGLVSKLEKMSSRCNVRNVILGHTASHLAGSLILIAAIIGFLRMQVQLFWMRRREASLRIVHGARRGQLFWLLFTEVCLVVAMSVAVAMLAGSWVETFLHTRLTALTEENPFLNIRHLSRYSLYIGFLLLLLCGGTIWVALARICKAGQGLSAYMKGSRTHFFRSVMLGLQITISILFFCGTLTITRWSGQMLNHYNVPDDLDFYKECVLLPSRELVKNQDALMTEIAHLPNLEKMIQYEVLAEYISEIADSPETKNALDLGEYLPSIRVADTSLVSFYHLKVKWLQKPACSGGCLLLNDSIYQKLCEMGVVSGNALTIRDLGLSASVVPIAGTISGIPYEEDRQLSVRIMPDLPNRNTHLILIPKEGRYQSLLHEAEDAVRRIEPSVVKTLAQNFHDAHADVVFAESIRTVGWILGLISLIICTMGIYSTISLDTRSRQKEVAIRKVCGAKSRDIYRLFGRVYIFLILLSLLVAIPMAVLFNRMMYTGEMIDARVWEGVDASPLIPCLAGSLIVILLIAAIVVMHIYHIMRTNPSEIIAKE